MCYEVPRALIDAIADAILAGPSVDGVRIAQSAKDGAINGFQLHMMRPSPLAERLGLANGDVMKSVNDLDLRVGSQALDLLRKLTDATHLTVVIGRGGKPLTYVYLVM